MRPHFLCDPFFSFSIRRKKRTAAPGEEKDRDDQSLALDLRRMKVLGCIRRQINDRHHQDSVRRVVARGKVIWGGQIKPGK